MSTLKQRAIWGLAALLVPPVLASPAFAQGAVSDSGGVNEIVVTAQRRTQNVLSVPLSITAVSGDQLADTGIRTLTDLQQTTPGYLPSDAAGYTQIFIRGIGSFIFFGANPSVATYIDDVPRIYGTMVNNMVDVERIEIIKGAPGGLYGRNATGGVVNIITHQPDTEAASGQARVTYGEKNTFRAAGYVNLPLNDNIAVLVSGERDSHDPYVKNLAHRNPYTAAMFPGGSVLGSAQATADFLNSGVDPQKGYGDQDFWTFSGKLLFKGGENFKITFAGDWNRKWDSNGIQLYNLNPDVAQANLVGSLNAFLGTNAQLPPGFLTGRGGKFTNSMGTDGYDNLKDYGGSATAVLNLPWADVTSITAYRKQRFTNIADLAATNVPNTVVHGDVMKHFFFQELRAVSTNEGPLRWAGGATYLRNYFKSRININLVPPLINELPLSLTTDHVKAWSVYAQLDYDITDRFTILVSGRYVHENNRGAYIIPVAPESNATEKKFLPSVTLSYKLPEGGNAYIRWARGFKSGGVNPIAPPNLFPDPSLGGTFVGETVDTFEAGYRASLFDHKLQLTAAAFYNDYKNLQTLGRTNLAHAFIILAIVNAGSARTWGLEGSATWRVIEPLTLGVTAGYLNAKYKDFAITDTTVYEPFDLSGETMFNSPKLQLAFTAELDQPLNDRFNLVGNAIVSHVSRVIWGPSGLQGVLPDPVEPGYWLTNVRLGVRTNDGRYEISAFADNLFNAAYSTYGSSSAAAGTTLMWGNPRIVGAEVRAKF